MTIMSRMIFMKSSLGTRKVHPIEQGEFQWFMSVGYFPNNPIGYDFKRDWEKESWFTEDENFLTLDRLLYYLNAKYPEMCPETKLGAHHAWAEFLIWRRVRSKDLKMPAQSEAYKGADHD